MSMKHPEKNHGRAAKLRRLKTAEQKKAKKVARLKARSARDKG